jgi:hypothetical protein
MPHADEPVKLRLKFAKSRDFYVETTTLTKQKMLVMGQQVVQDQEQVFVQHWQPEEMTPDGDWLVRIRIVRTHLKIDLGGNRVPVYLYDNLTKSAGNDFFDSLRKAEFKATIQAAGLIRKVQGREEFLKMLERDSRSAHQSLFSAIITEDWLKQTITPLGNSLPAAPVRVGEGWARNQTLDLGPIGRYVTNFQYTYAGNVGPLHEIRVKSSLGYTRPGTNGDAHLPFKIRKADLKSTHGEGKVFFDVEKGRVHEANSSMRLAGKLMIMVGSTETEVVMEHTQNVRMRTTEKLPPLPM